MAVIALIETASEIATGVGDIVTVSASVDTGARPTFYSPATGRRLAAELDGLGVWTAMWATAAPGDYAIRIEAEDAAPVIVVIHATAPGPDAPGYYGTDLLALARDARNLAIAARTGAVSARVAAVAARAGAEDARDEAEGLVLSDLGTTDGQTRALIEMKGSQVTGALASLYAPTDAITAGTSGVGNELFKVGNVLGPGAPGTFDGLAVEGGFKPFLDPKSGRWAAFYVAYGDDTGVTRASVGVVYSDDLLNWDKYGRHQIIKFSGVPGSQDFAGVTAPVLIMWGDVYYVFVCGLTETGYEGGTNHNILLFSSTELTAPAGTWTEHGVVMQPDATVEWRAQNLWHCDFVQHGGKIYNFVNASLAPASPGAPFPEVIGLYEAEHPEGPWTPRDDVSPLLEPLGPGTKEETIVGDPCVTKIPNGWRMDYYAAGQGGAFDFYATCTDDNFPAGPWVRGNDGDPILVPGPLGSSDDLFAHKPGIVRAGGRVFHFYTAVTTEDPDTRHVALAVDPPFARDRVLIHKTDDDFTFYDLNTNAYATPGGFYKSLRARPGDWVQVEFGAVYNETAGDGRCDIAIMDAATVVDGNTVTGTVIRHASRNGATGGGIPHFGAIGGRYETAGGSFSFELEEGDVIDGKVTLALALRADGGPRALVYGGATPSSIHYVVRNLS